LGFPSQEGIDKKRDERPRESSVNIFHSMVDTYYLQHVNLVSSGKRKNLPSSVRMPGCTFLDFCRLSDSAVKNCCLVKRPGDDVLKSETDPSIPQHLRDPGRLHILNH
jgi:hypothetical protein